MKKNMKSALKVAVLAGFMAGAAAKATAADKMKKATEGEGDKAAAEKSGCAGPNGCSGECTGKDAKKDGMKKADHMKMAPKGKMKKDAMAVPTETNTIPPATEPVKK